ncbi:MAG TPA: phosphomannomutase/phosphoglucomutase [Smithellaceae bacterium]|nr:phosphomannomutase/phosphoglucomutase [Smithellaceae bacterium]HQM46124.1 phosphomannomutase/phosphoglucomutase [Smithellaceae bacterium]
MNPNVFRECDVRGIVDQDLNEIFIVNLGRAIGAYALKRNIKTMTVGRDCRLSSEAYSGYLISGLNASGLDTIDIGLCPTPMLYFSIRHCGAGGGVMVTGSHNPPEFNGFKICIGHDAIYGTEIQCLKKIMESGSYISGRGQASQINITEAYQNHLFSHITISNKLHVVLDAGNGVGGQFALPLLNQLGCKVTALHCDPDGRFPHHFPDPSVLENLQDLISTVTETKADVGIAFDGDADRIGVVDHNGEVIWADQLLLLFARSILKKHPGSAIIGEVKCSQTLFDDIEKNGGHAIMWKTGHSLLKSKIRDEKALLGGDMSGHIFFADRHFGYDDAIYAALRLLEILSESNQTIEALLADTPKTFATPEIRLHCDDDQKKILVEKIRKRCRHIPNLIEIDGVRIPFADGWALVRASNTQPALVLRFESDSAEGLQRIRNKVEEWLALEQELEISTDS